MISLTDPWLRPLRLACNVLINLRRCGLKGTIRLYSDRISETYRDWRLGISSSGFIPSNELHIDLSCSGYGASDYRCLDVVFQYLRLEAGNDVFVDYGCGKGRVVVMAAYYPVRRVIGIEASPVLSEIAKKNVQRARGNLACKNVEIITVDAVDYKVPPDVSVIFLCNPFTGSVLSAVQRQIYESIRKTPRPLRIVYSRPAKVPDAFVHCEWLLKICELPTRIEANVAVYEATTHHISALCIGCDNALKEAPEEHQGKLPQ